MKNHLILFAYGLLLLTWGANSVHAQFPSAINLDTIGDNGLMISRVAKVVPAIPVPPTFPILQPGTGWTGPTEQPDTIGDSTMFGYDAKVIARWDVVPYQTFDDQFHIGVVAFHMNDIDRVSFSVDGGPWLDVHEIKMNPRTDVEEYTAILDANLFAQDEPVEVRAIVWPKVAGIPRVLAGDITNTTEPGDNLRSGENSMILYVGTDPQIIEVDSGVYTWGLEPFVGSQDDNSRWITFRPAPGVSREEVIINDNITSQPGPDGSMQLKKVRLQNITLMGSGLLRYIGGNQNPDEEVWLDSCEWIGLGQWVNSGTNKGVRWATNCTMRQWQVGPISGFVRGTQFSEFGEDVMRNVYFVANVTVRNVDRGPRTDWHTAVIGNPYYCDNRIYYNLNVTDNKHSVWAFRNGTHDLWQNFDIAVVNCHSTSTAPHNWWMGADSRNVLIMNTTFEGNFAWRWDGNIREEWKFKPYNVVLQDVLINSDTVPSSLDAEGITIRYTE